MYVITYILEDSIFSYVNHFKFRSNHEAQQILVSLSHYTSSTFS